MRVQSPKMRQDGISPLDIVHSQEGQLIMEISCPF